MDEKRKKGGILLAGVMCVCLDLSVLENLAIAGCPSLKPVTSPLEAVKQYLPKPGSPVSEEQLIKMVVELVNKGVISPVDVRPSVGPAPLTVRFGFVTNPLMQNPVEIEVDIDGDGKPEGVETKIEALLGREYTYQKEGEYQFTVRTYDNSGRATTYRTPVKVLSSKAFDAELQARWNQLKEALGHGDASEALECIHTHSRDKYKETFDAFGSRLSLLGADMPAIEPVDFANEYAKYRLRRQQQVGDQVMTITHYVYFSVDTDGIWRIESF